MQRSLEGQSPVVTVRRRDGIHVDRGPAGTLVADASTAVGALNVVSHAHADHTFRRTPETVVCSRATAAIAAARSGRKFEYVSDHPAVTLRPAGHVLGSRVACFSGQRPDGSETRYCYTGDFTLEDRWYLEGFDPDTVDADVLVMETTYGQPRYQFPDAATLESEIRAWLRENDDRPLFLFGYTLGRAQKLLALVSEDPAGIRDGGEARRGIDGREVLVSAAIDRVSSAMETVSDCRFPGRPYDSLRGLSDEIVVLPSNQARADWVRDAVEREAALTAGFSGWAIDDGFRFRGAFDAVFPLSDHADFDALCRTVEAIDPDRIYTHHGFADAFATRLETEYGYTARALKRDQRTLEEFQ